MDSVLECVSLTKKYSAKTALDGISVSVPKGAVVGLLGPNGSGKTTLVSLVFFRFRSSGGRGST